MPNVVPLFAVPVFVDDFSISSVDREFCRNLEMKHDGPANMDITTESRVLNLPQLHNLKSLAQTAIDTYTRDVLRIPQHVRFNITTSWYTTVTDRSTISNHYHSHSLFTGVIVFDAPSGSRITLSQETPSIVPKMFDFDYLEFNIFNSKTWWLDLVPNNIYIFPSTINHSAHLMEKDTSMNLLAFDTFVNGIIGEDINEIHITTA